MMKFSRTASALVAAFAFTGIVVANDDFDPEPIIQARQAALRDVGGAFKTISDELKKPAPSMPTITSNARQIEELIRHQKDWFPAGTGPESEIETVAKPEIWTSKPEFEKLQAAFAEQSKKLVQVSAGGDKAAIQSQWRELGKTCKGCHDKFREEE